METEGRLQGCQDVQVPSDVMFKAVRERGVETLTLHSGTSVNYVIHRNGNSNSDWF